jgi:hypothetical protein
MVHTVKQITTPFVPPLSISLIRSTQTRNLQQQAKSAVQSSDVNWFYETSINESNVNTGFAFHC